MAKKSTKAEIDFKVTEVKKLIAEGKTLKEACATIGLSVGTWNLRQLKKKKARKASKEVVVTPTVTVSTSSQFDVKFLVAKSLLKQAIDILAEI